MVRHVRSWGGPPAAALLTGAVGLHRLGEKSFWIDEGSTGWAILGSWSRLWETTTEHEPNLGAYYALLKVWSVVGTSEAKLRLFSVLCMAGAAALLVVLGRRLFNPRVGFVAGVVFGVNAFVLRFAQEARPYALSVSTVAAASLLLVLALDKGSARWWVAYTTTALVAVLAHPWAATVVAAHMLAMLFHANRPRWKPIVVTIVPIAVILAPFVHRLLTKDVNRFRWIRPTTWRAFGSTMEALAGGNRPVLGLYLAAGALALTTLVRSRRLDWPTLYVGMLFVVPIGLILVASEVVQPFFIARYLIVAVPGFILLVAAGIDRLRFTPAVAVGTAVVVFAAIPGLRDWYDSDFKADWRNGVALVADRSEPGDVVLVHRQGRAAFQYYDSSHPVLILRQARARRSELEERDRIWLVLYPETEDATATAFQADLTRSYRLADEFEVNRLLIRLFVKMR